MLRTGGPGPGELFESAVILSPAVCPDDLAFGGLVPERPIGDLLAINSNRREIVDIRTRFA